MTDKQIRKMTDQYLRNDIKIIRHDTRIKKNLMIVVKDSILFVLIIYILFN
jgi:hypothetical protein